MADATVSFSVRASARSQGLARQGWGVVMGNAGTAVRGKSASISMAWRAVRLAVAVACGTAIAMAGVTAAGAVTHAGRPSRPSVHAGAGSAISVNLPKITSVSPSSGAPGWAVTITGSGFTGVTKVTFGGVAASFKVASASVIHTTVPAKAASGWLVVRKPAGQARTSFTVTPRDTLATGET